VLVQETDTKYSIR